MFDFLIVGAGMFGAVCARELTDAGKTVLVIDKRDHIGGQCYTETRDGQVMNLYGGHIFHTNDRRLWEYVHRFGLWRQYSHHVKAKAGGAVYSFPPNRMTYQQAGTDDVGAMRKLFFEGYTEKMWARPIAEVPTSVLKRIPVRDDWNDEYFSDTYQGIPVNGYTPLFEEMLFAIPTALGVDYLAQRSLSAMAHQTIYTGPLDLLFDCDRGALEWRGMRFEHRREEVETYQGCPTMNYCDREVPWLREEEWKYFYPPSERTAYSWVSRHYPDNTERLYPVNDEANNRLAAEYRARAEAAGYIVGGRLGGYRYLDMHQAIAAALQTVKGIL